MMKHVNWWTAEQDETIIRMIGEGKSGAEIGKVLGRTRMSVISRNHRLREIAERKTLNRTPYVKIRFTAEEDATIIRLSDASQSGREIAMALKRSAASIIKRARLLGKPLHAKSGAKKQDRPRDNVIQFPTRRKLPQGFKAVKPAPTLRVVSHNIPLMIEDWLAKHGGPRRFNDHERTDDIVIVPWLAERGIKISKSSHRWNESGGNWKVSRGSGRPKTLPWAGVLQIVDEIRLSEGLPLFNAMPAASARQAGRHLREAK
jgi:hypothetical protein